VPRWNHLNGLSNWRVHWVGTVRQPICCLSRYIAYAQGIQLQQAGRLARRLLRYGEASADPIVRAYGWTAWGIHQWDVGDIGDAQRHLAQANALVLADEPLADGWQLRRDLRLLWPVWFAFTTALYGDLEGARGILD